VRFLLTASFPTDVSDRNPRSSIFVEPSGDNDARIFGEQIGHAAPLFGLPVTDDPVFKLGQILDSLQHAATGCNAALIVSHQFKMRYYPFKLVLLLLFNFNTTRRGDSPPPRTGRPL
jgi:hypothetical protein